MGAAYVVGALLVRAVRVLHGGFAESDRDANGVYFSGAAVIAVGVLVFASGFPSVANAPARRLEAEPHGTGASEVKS